MNVTKKIRMGCLSLLLAAMGSHAFAQTGKQSDLIINEIQVCNIDQFIDPSYNYGGWVELYNPTENTINLGNLYVSNDEENLLRWQLSASQGTVEPGGFAILWFDHYDTGNMYSNEAYKQIGFKLTYEGGTLYICDSQGKLIASQEYPQAIQRTSYARISDGGDTWGITSTPTPGSSNEGSTFAEEQLEAPTVDCDATLYTTPFYIQVSKPAGSTLRYTTDGSVPTLENGSTSYGGRIYVNGGTKIYRFRVFKDGYLPSAVVTRSYIYQDKDYYLPIISVVTDERNLYDDTIGAYTVGTNGISGLGVSTNTNKNRSWERPVNFEYLVPENTDGGSFLMALNQECDFEVCGGWSRNLYAPNASFRLKSGKYYLGQNFLPYAFFQDKPYIKSKTIQVRNGGNDGNARILDAATHQIMLESGMYIDVQATQPAHVFINGKFMFTYNVREPNNKNHGYSNYGIDTDEMDQFEIRAGYGYKQMVGSDETFIRWMNLAQQLAKNPTDDSIYEEICELVDIAEYCNYMAAECYIGSSDWLTNCNNVKGYRSQADGKFHLVVMDADACFQFSDMISRLPNHLYNGNAGFKLTGRNYLIDIFLNMMEYEPFRRRFVDTFCLVDGSVFETRRSTNIINAMRSRTEKAMGFEASNSLNGSANWLINRISDQRSNRLDNFKSYMSSYKLNTTYGTTISADVPMARLSVNNLEIPTGKFSGVLFNPAVVRAQPVPGYDFTGWLLNDSRRTLVFNTGANWTYYDKGPMNDENWKEEDFSTDGWSSGNAPLGYGNVGMSGSSDYSTTLDYGSDASNKRPTYYFRKTFKLPGLPSETEGYQLRCYVDDGCVVYVNGQEIGRYLMPDGKPTYNTYTTTYVGATAAVLNFDIDNSLLHMGNNLIAVEVHNTSGTSSDIYWTAALYHLENNDRFVSTEREVNLSTLGTRNISLTACYAPMEERELMPNNVFPLRVNEVSAGNSVFINEYFKKNDWVELYNTTDTELDAAGLYISDNANNPFKYQIPGNADFNTKVPPHGHLILWADKLESLTQLHAPFKLENEDGNMVLITSSEEFVANNQAFFDAHPSLCEFTDKLEYCNHKGDQSVGRYPDGSNRYYLMYRPTIGRMNSLLPEDDSLGFDPTYTAVEPTLASQDNPISPVGYYTLSGLFMGRESSSLRSGIYVVRLSNGKSQKIVVK